MENLTKRETQILRMVADEFSSEDIAVKLNLSIRTVETHRKNIAAKVGSSNLAALTKYAIKNKIISI